MFHDLTHGGFHIGQCDRVALGIREGIEIELGIMLAFAICSLSRNFP